VKAAWRRLLGPHLVRSLLSPPLAEAVPPPPAEVVQALAARLDAAARARLGRSLAIRHVNAGSCNGCELEIEGMRGTLHDLERFGLRFVASPRHADVLLVTGPLTRNMREALLRAAASTPEPRWVVAAGDCAVDGGLFQGSHAVEGGIDAALPVDLLIPGCPPTPGQLLQGMLALLESQRTG
jgi:Ni,Fe-hydrogenase III small subunit